MGIRSIGDYRDDIRTAATVADQAIEIGKTIFVSCNSASDFSASSGITPESTSGTRVLDLGSGLSDFVAFASEAGGNIVGVDTAYADVSTLEEKGRVFLDHVRTQCTPAMLREYEDSFYKALQDVAQNPSRYIAADVLCLPFQNGIFDKVVANCFLTSDAGAAPDFTLATILEALRVTRRGGEFYLGPNNTKLGDGIWGVEVEENIRQAFAEAEAQKLASKLVRYNVNKDDVRYVITRSRKR